ncbi:zinc finger BED domain-containing protein RICESLEEPER 2-like protein [Tanacetum coccineum]
MFEHGNGNKMMAWKFNQKESKKALAHMVIVDEIPFSFVQYEGFRHYSKINQPLFNVPCRGATTQDCYNLYEEEKNNLLNVIQKNIGRICLTTDSWTSLGKKSYMALIGVESCMNGWGINAIMAISIDNASANDMQDGIKSVDKAIENIRYAVKWIKKLVPLEDEILYRIAKVMKKKFDKYYGEIENMNALLYFAFLLDPRNKDEFLHIVVDDHYGAKALAMVELKKKYIYAQLKALYEDYVRIHALPSNSSSVL